MALSPMDHHSCSTDRFRGLTPPRRCATLPWGEQMAKRTDYTPEKPFSAEQLSEIRRNFALLSLSSLQTAYSEALEKMSARKGWPAPESGTYSSLGAGMAPVEKRKVSAL
jgi:hypothetical protein